MDDVVVVKKTGQANLRVRRIVYYIFGVLEILLACRFVLKLFGANPNNMFVSFIYSVSHVFLLPFAGIFGTAVAKGAVTLVVFEPSTIIAVIVYAVVAWGIVKLIIICSAPRKTIIR
jgi:hypothetical protein